PLLQPGLQVSPGLSRDHPGDDVEREDLLGPLGIRVHGEGDAVVAKHLHRQVVAAGKLLRPQPVQGVVERPIARPGLARRRKHFVIEAVGLVVDAKGFRGGHRYSVGAPMSGNTINLRVGCEFAYEVSAPTPATVQVRPRSDSSHRLVTETWSTTPEVPVDEYSDVYGNPVKRFVMPSGNLALRYDAICAVPDDA